MLGEITDEILELCVWLRAGKHEDYEKAFAVYRALHDQLAARKKAEHLAVCGVNRCNITDAQWQEFADRELKGEK